MDPTKEVGHIIAEGAHVHRDAIHIAVLPATAGERLTSRDRVCLAYGTSNVAIRARDDDYGLRPSIGIVDPFLALSEYVIEKGQRFWIFLHPGTVTGMRHQWFHPEVDSPVAPASDAEKWLHDFADRWGFDYDNMIAVCTNPDHNDAWLTAHGSDLHDRSELGENYDLLWQNLSILTGKTFDDAHKDKIGWSCSC